MSKDKKPDLPEEVETGKPGQVEPQFSGNQPPPPPVPPAPPPRDPDTGG